MIDTMIRIFSSGRYKINRKNIISEVHLFAKKNRIRDDALINIIFVGRRKMRAIAREYKKENVALPVLSFSYQQKKDLHKAADESETIGSDIDNEGLMGEVFICYPQAVLLAAEREYMVDKMIVELICHGIENIISS